jgi:hypothetical protein
LKLPYPVSPFSYRRIRLAVSVLRSVRFQPITNTPLLVVNNKRVQTGRETQLDVRHQGEHDDTLILGVAAELKNPGHHSQSSTSKGSDKMAMLRRQLKNLAQKDHVK